MFQVSEDLLRSLDDLSRVPFYGAAVVCMDDPNVRAILPRVDQESYLEEVFSLCERYDVKGIFPGCVLKDFNLFVVTPNSLRWHFINPLTIFFYLVFFSATIFKSQIQISKF